MQAEGQHRDHAIVEQVFADVTDGPLAHVPSGSFAANAAWTACAAIAHNLLRAARSGRGHITLHLPEGWHREHQWLTLFAACGPPAAAA